MIKTIPSRLIIWPFTPQMFIKTHMKIFGCIYIYMNCCATPAFNS